jgi:hypothetical protein
LRKNSKIVTGKKKTIEKTKQRNHKKPEQTQREGPRTFPKPEIAAVPPLGPAHFIS